MNLSPLWDLRVVEFLRIMFYNLKIALRNLRFNRTYSIINIVGLAIALAVVVLIMLWVWDERSYDRFHNDSAQVFRVITKFKSEDTTIPASPGPFVTVAENNFDEVESYCRTLIQSTKYVKSGNIRTGEKQLFFADSTFFSVFNFPILQGQTQELLRTSDDAVISESLARELFSDKNPIGQTILIESFPNLHVVAVMKDFPENTSIPRVNIICSHKTLLKSSDWVFSYYNERLTEWGGCEFTSYLRIKKGANTEKIAQKVADMQPENQKDREFMLQSLVDARLYNMDGEPARLQTVHLFQWIAIAILCIACMNYIIIVTARSSERRFEIGIKKIIGARKISLFFQLITETVVLLFIAMVIAVLLNMLLLPFFNHLSGKNVSIAWTDFRIWLAYGSMFFIVILVAGIYPAITLSSFKPIKSITKKKNPFFRKLLVIMQFATSFVLIAVTITFGAQLRYLNNKNLGYDREFVLTCNLQKMGERYGMAKDELLKNAAILELTGASNDIVELRGGSYLLDWEGKVGEATLMYNHLSVDSTFFNVMRIRFVEGGGFTSSSKEQVVINETAAKAMGLKEPIVGQLIKVVFGQRVIVGVIKDFHINSLYEKISPLLISPSLTHAQCLYIRTTTADAPKAIAAVETLWKQYNPDYTFSYNFMDDSFKKIYLSDLRTGMLFGVFSLIAVFISCLGLFGLVTYTTEARTKEIGIRKVFGASVASIVQMLSKGFLILVGISMLIALPLAYYWLSGMLQNYAYRIPISWWIFGLSAAIIILLTVLTVGFKAFKAASANPVKSIKTE